MLLNIRTTSLALYATSLKRGVLHSCGRLLQHRAVLREDELEHRKNDLVQEVHEENAASPSGNQEPSVEANRLPRRLHEAGRNTEKDRHVVELRCGGPRQEDARFVVNVRTPDVDRLLIHRVEILVKQVNSDQLIRSNVIAIEVPILPLLPATGCVQVQLVVHGRAGVVKLEITPNWVAVDWSVRC